MLVLIQVSSMKTSLAGSSLPCQDLQRWRRRATPSRACSRANRVFFEPQPLAPQEEPHGIVRNPYAARRQQVFQTMQRQMRGSIELLHDKGAMRLQNGF